MKAKAGVEYDGTHWIVHYPWSRWRKRRRQDEALAAAILDLLHSPPGKVWSGPLAKFIDYKRLREAAAKGEAT